MTTPAVETERALAGFPCLHARPAGPARGQAVFLHGAFGDHTVFRNYLRRFAAAGYECFAAARRGRLGLPPAGARGVTIDDYLADTRAVLDAVGGSPVLVGHSLGGLLAQVLAAEGRASAAVLVATAPPGMLTAQPAALPVYLPNLPRILLGLPFAVPAGGCARVALNAVPDPDLRARIHATLNPESGLVYRAMMFGSVRVDAAKVRCPVLVLGGEEDRVVSAALTRSTAAHYGADLRLYPGRAHWLPEEPGWDAICDDILGWLAAPARAGQARAS